jgi:type I restriction enzyme S subunit
MASGYKAYPEYKYSGVEWLGDVPIHWNIKRLGQFFEERREKVSDKDYPPLSVTMKGIVPQLDNAAKSDAGDNRKLVLKNDFVINSRSDRKGSSGISPLDGSVSLISIVMEPKRINPKFAHHLLRSYPFQEEFYRYGKGIVADLWSTNSSEMKNILLPEIGDEESKAIANFLDYETAKIDTLIEKQQQLIKLLKEKRQAVISHAVTKGLNPQAPMKYSGVEWLGEVPDHWGIKRNKHLMEFVTSGSRGWAEYYSDDGALFFRITNLTRDTVEPKLESIQNVKPPAGSEGERSKIRSGDLLISITADLGSVCVADDSVAGGFVSQHVSLCRPNSLVVSSRWLAYFILSDAAKEQFIGSGYGGTKIQLSLEDIRELNIAYPPVSEQGEIALYIDTKLEKFALLMNRAESQVNLLQERRTALISAAVTGKIDVRNWEQPND